MLGNTGPKRNRDPSSIVINMLQGSGFNGQFIAKEFCMYILIKEIYRQSSVKKPTSKIFQVKIPSEYYKNSPILTFYPNR